MLSCIMHQITLPYLPFPYYPNLLFLAITFEPEKLDGKSKALKTCNIAYFPLKTWVEKLALGIGAQGLVTSTKDV